MLCAPELSVTTVTKGFEEVAERDLWPSNSLSVDSETGV